MARKPNKCPEPIPQCEPMRPTSPPPPRRRKEACSNSCIAKQVELRANEKAAFFALREMSRTLGEMFAAFKVIMADNSRHADSITDDEVAAFIHNILHP